MFPKYHQESEGSFFSANESPKRLYVGCLPAQLMNAREYLSLKIEATLCLFPNQMLSISQEHPVMCCGEHNPVSKLFLPKNHISIFKQSIDWCLGLSTIACPISDNGSCCRELLQGEWSIGERQALWSVVMDITDKFSSTLNPSWI